MKKFYFLILLSTIISCTSKEAEQKFIKNYRLLKLDGELCKTCILRVKEGYIYEIIKDGKTVGTGKWELEMPIDFPGFVLQLENGPTWMVYESDTIIDFIDRRQ